MLLLINIHSGSGRCIALIVGTSVADAAFHLVFQARIDLWESAARVCPPSFSTLASKISNLLMLALSDTCMFSVETLASIPRFYRHTLAGEMR